MLQHITPNTLGFQMPSLFPCRLYYLLGNVLAVSCERSLQFSNSKCKVSGLAELQDLRKEVQAVLGQEPGCQIGCISMWICRGNAHTHTHAGVHAHVHTQVELGYEHSQHQLQLHLFTVSAAAAKWNWRWDCACLPTSVDLHLP